MPLMNGARLGSYEILALVGAGGMGEDTRALRLTSLLYSELIVQSIYFFICFKWAYLRVYALIASASSSDRGRFKCSDSSRNMRSTLLGMLVESSTGGSSVWAGLPRIGFVARAMHVSLALIKSMTNYSRMAATASITIPTDGMTALSPLRRRWSPSTNTISILSGGIPMTARAPDTVCFDLSSVMRLIG